MDHKEHPSSRSPQGMGNSGVIGSVPKKILPLGDITCFKPPRSSKWRSVWWKHSKKIATSSNSCFNSLTARNPPRSRLFGYFQRWEWDGTLERIHHALYQQCRAQAGRAESPRAAIIDSQSVKSAEKGGPRLTRRGTTAARKSRERNTTSLLISSA